MTTLREAATQALGALEEATNYTSCPTWSPSMTEECEAAAAALRAALAEPAQERNFCPRCGKRSTGIHTCTPPAPLTDEVIADLWHKNGGFHHHFARAIERAHGIT